MSDPRRIGWRGEEALLKQVARRVNDIVQSMNDAEAAFMVRHQLQIQSFLTQGQGTLGEVIFSKHLDHIQSVLGQFEGLHPRLFEPHNGLNSQTFFELRHGLLSQLHQSLGPLVVKDVGMTERNVRAKVSSRAQAYFQHWSQVGAPGEVVGYATHLESVAKASTYLMAGGWLGIALRDCTAARKIAALCRMGREHECHAVNLCDSRSWGIELNGPRRVAEVGVWVALGVGLNERLACALVITPGFGPAALPSEQIYQVSS